MAYDTYSAEITALDGVGDKLSAAITNAETRTASFDACVMSATAKTSGMTQKLPSGAYITSLVITEYTEGGAAGYTIPFDEMLEAYYVIRSWDLTSGHPSQGKLFELGLSWVDN